MKTVWIYVITIFILNNTCIAQKYFTKNGNISFFSATNIENIKADNNQVVSVLNTANGRRNLPPCSPAGCDARNRRSVPRRVR